MGGWQFIEVKNKKAGRVVLQRAGFSVEPVTRNKCHRCHGICYGSQSASVSRSIDLLIENKRTTFEEVTEFSIDC